MSLSKDKLAELIARAKEKKAQLEATQQVQAPATITPVTKPVAPASSVLVPSAPMSKLEQLRAKLAAQKVTLTPTHEITTSALTNPPGNSVLVINPDAPTAAQAEATDKYGNTISYNQAQQQFITLASSGSSCCLIGAAGTGKTTVMKGVVNSLIQSGKAGILKDTAHKHLRDGTPGIVICAYTRRAVDNIRRNMPDDLKANCITIHKLLEYAPTKDIIVDETTGVERERFLFAPARGAEFPLPESIHTIIFEESSMLGTPLYKEVIAALPHRPQEIFLGDICQLPPVFGPAILGFKLSSLPTVELTEVYRQALESPIISLAHRILSGNPIAPEEFPNWHFPGKLTIHPWKKKIHADIATLTIGKFFEKAITEKQYDPEEDIILIPFGVSFGTIEVNKHVANFLARMRNAVTHEIVAGFNKHYFSAGDRCMYEKEDCVITKIESNLEYAGAKPQPASANLDYWGFTQLAASGSHNSVASEVEAAQDDDVDFLLAQVAAQDGEDRVRAASHCVTLLRVDSGTEVTISTASELNNLDLGYALTVHKSQGSEWRKVFALFHQSHATMIYNELLYTGVTRAREELYIICEPDTFIKGIKNRRIQGTTLQEKAVYFRGKYGEEDAIGLD